MNFRYRFMQFMSGRNGADAFFYGLFIIACVLAFINIFLRLWVLQIIVYGIMFYAIFRYLSRNISARSNENRKFNDFLNVLRRKSEIARQRKADTYHVYRKCKKCKAVLRLPRRIGKHKTVCPKCNHEFTVRVRR